MPKRRREGAERDKNSRRFGERLAQLRKKRGITQVELGEQLGVGQGLISHLEHGRRNFDAQLIIDIAAVLGVSADDLLGISSNNGQQAQPQVQRRFLRKLQDIERLSRRDQTALLRTIDAFIRGQLERTA